MAKGIVIHSKKPYKRLSKAEWAYVVRMYEKGKSANYLGEKVGIYPTSITSGLRRRGVKIRSLGPQKHLTKDQWRKIKFLYNQGKSAYELAKVFPIDRCNIVRKLRRDGVRVKKRYIHPIKLKLTERAYIAGLFDGEGSISIATVKRKDGTRTGSHFIYITVTNTDYSILCFLKRKLGGTIRESTRSSLSRKPVWHWAANGRASARILRAILKFLRIKKKRASLALNLADRIPAWAHKMSQGEFDRRDKVRLEIIRLNGRKATEACEENYNKSRKRYHWQSNPRFI